MMLCSRIKGFTLIETAVALAVVGILVGSVFSFTGTENNALAKQITVQREKRIATALASYAQLQNKLPCPASPDTTTGNARSACATTALRNGIIPYRTLGLNRQDIIDGWDNPFSYTVAGEAVAPSVNRVHANCRSVPTWIASIIGPTRNASKAAFCCQVIGAYDEIIIYTNTARTVRVGLIQTLLALLSYGNAGLIGLPLTANVGYIAYVLVSHGKNGEGAYILGTTSRNLPAAGITGVSERYNADDDSVFNLVQQNPNIGSDYYDDIALWRTQEMVMSEFGNNSCSAP